MGTERRRGRGVLAKVIGAGTKDCPQGPDVSSAAMGSAPSGCKRSPVCGAAPRPGEGPSPELQGHYPSVGLGTPAVQLVPLPAALCLCGCCGERTGTRTSAFGQLRCYLGLRGEEASFKHTSLLPHPHGLGPPPSQPFSGSSRAPCPILSDPVPRSPQARLRPCGVAVCTCAQRGASGGAGYSGGGGKRSSLLLWRRAGWGSLGRAKWLCPGVAGSCGFQTRLSSASLAASSFVNNQLALCDNRLRKFP